MVFLRSLARVSSRALYSSKTFAPTSVRSFSAGKMRFLESHEYLRMTSETEGTVGVTDFAQSELGDVVYVELPTVGDKLKKGDPFGSVESVKAASQVYAPVDGEVTAVNSALSEDSGLINSSPEDAGWIMKMKITNPSQLSSLLDAAAYAAHCESEKH